MEEAIEVGGVGFASWIEISDDGRAPCLWMWSRVDVRRRVSREAGLSQSRRPVSVVGNLLLCRKSGVQFIRVISSLWEGRSGELGVLGRGGHGVSVGWRRGEMWCWGRNVGGRDGLFFRLVEIVFVDDGCVREDVAEEAGEGCLAAGGTAAYADYCGF